MTQEMTQILGHVPRCRVPLRGSFRESFQTDTIQFLRNGVVHLAGWTWLTVDNLLQQFVLRIRLKRSPSGQQFVTNDTQTENVAADIDPVALASGLFRTHVGRRPSVAWPLAHILLAQGQTEIGDKGLAAAVKENVAGLDVPMHQPLLVGVV